MSQRTRGKGSASSQARATASALTKEDITELFNTLGQQMEDRLTRKVQSDMDTLLRCVDEKVEAKLRDTTNLPQRDSQLAEREIKELVEDAVKESLSSSKQVGCKDRNVGQMAKVGGGRGLYPTITAAKKHVNRVKPLIDT